MQLDTIDTQEGEKTVRFSRKWREHRRFIGHHDPIERSTEWTVRGTDWSTARADVTVRASQYQSFNR